MSLFSNIGSAIDATVREKLSNVGAYLGTTVGEPLVALGDKAKGNLSALELEQGLRGAAPVSGVASSSAPAPVSRSIIDKAVSTEKLLNLLPILAIGAVAAYSFFRRKK